MDIYDCDNEMLDGLKRLQRYREHQYRSIRGYSATILLSVLLPLIEEFQNKKGIAGDVGEIGVHHGRFFFALDALRATGERAVVADVFANQDLNIDKSGRGDREAFESHLYEVSHDPGGVTIYEGDSLAPEFHNLLCEGKFTFRLFSVDGGHTVHHALNDMLLADAHMCNGGIILLDDFCNPGFPGVSEAAFLYLQRAPRLVPVCTMSTKLAFMSISYAEEFRRFVRKKLKNNTNLRIRSTWVGGSESLHLIRADVRHERGARVP